VRRTGIEDIKSLSAMIIQSERFGTSLSQALKVYTEALRTRRRLRAEAAVGKAGIKMLFPVILFIPPALFVVTLVPGVLSVLRDLRTGSNAPRRWDSQPISKGRKSVAVPVLSE
jgi:tight adherence protein C